MASYELNEAAVARAKAIAGDRNVVLVTPDNRDENDGGNENGKKKGHEKKQDTATETEPAVTIEVPPTDTEP